MPRNLTRDRGNVTYDSIIRDSLERQRTQQRVRDWANQPYVPARMASKKHPLRRWWAGLDGDRIKTTLYGAGTLLLMAGIGLMLAYRG